MYQLKDALYAMSWLTYGLTDENDLISIEFVERGLSNLHCPYCGGLLTAKKGRKLAHHFAHSHESCSATARSAGELPLLPLYDHFTLDLSKAEAKELAGLWQKYGAEKRKVRSPRHSGLVDKGFLRWNDFIGGGRDRGGYEFTKLGKVPVGALSMNLFAKVQHELFIKRLVELEAAISGNLHRLHCDVAIHSNLANLRLYRTQLKRLLIAYTVLSASLIVFSHSLVSMR